MSRYGTTTSPIIFVEGYVSLKDWWRVGFHASVANVAIRIPVGLSWWEIAGLW